MDYKNYAKIPVVVRSSQSCKAFIRVPASLVGKTIHILIKESDLSQYMVNEMIAENERGRDFTRNDKGRI